MKKFMNEDFLLTTSAGKKLYHSTAAKCPVIDYNSHLSAKDIFEHRKYKNLTELWLGSDNELMNVMRLCGTDEFYVSGVAADYDKFLKFAEIMPYLIGNPVYHWVHLELQRLFGIHIPLTGKSAPEIWHRTGEKLDEPGCDIVSLLEALNVKVICIPADPGDDLEWYFRCSHSDSIPFHVLPVFCPGRIINIDRPEWFNAITQLGTRYGTVHDWNSLKAALSGALDYFCKAGCRVADDDFEDPGYAAGDPDSIIEKIIHHGSLTAAEADSFKGAVQQFLKEEYSRRGMMIQPAERRCGISEQLEQVMETGVLGKTAGMMTDSRSFTVLVRHEYYRRILCDKIGKMVEDGHYPADLDFLSEMIQDICWRNAVKTFGFEI